MKLTQKQFDRAMTYVHQGRSTAEVAALCNVSERVVQRIKKAGTWDRWPYIVAKTTHGYMTPEYKLYLKRRGLPIAPPSKVKMYGSGHKMVITSDEILEDNAHTHSHFERLKRWFTRGK